MKTSRTETNRRSIRLPGYDYSQAGAYFVTIVAEGRKNVFGEIETDEVFLTPAGKMIHNTWLSLPDRFPHIELDEFIVMPNHFHAILFITTESNRVGTSPTPTNFSDPVGVPLVGTLGEIIGAYKSITTHEYILGVRGKNWPSFEKRLWQRNYYEHILRTDNDLTSVRSYILGNPQGWNLDPENPAFIEKS